MTDFSTLSDSDLDTALTRAVAREEQAHAAIKKYEDEASQGDAERKPATRVQEYTPLQDELEAAETEREAIEAEQQRRRS
jgi:hypothetical protein